MVLIIDQRGLLSNLTDEEWIKGRKRKLDTSKYCRANLLTIEKFVGKVSNKEFCDSCHIGRKALICKILRSQGY